MADSAAAAGFHECPGAGFQRHRVGEWPGFVPGLTPGRAIFMQRWKFIKSCNHDVSRKWCDMANPAAKIVVMAWPFHRRTEDFLW
ncbi:hypothetical protein EQ718_26435 (plasmid) [Paracoccus versutus]|uniref:hypothetical protein n=1 Tax=Paracoccus versutus TaxID=34007 RepID=UPI0012EDFCD3|nr:hypothetical protein [Paracoccus versutus]WEJ82318.1 hypothetical protein EQ718_26435 [Paracoccus versutus]